MLEKEQNQTIRHLHHIQRLLEISRELTSTMSLAQLLNLITEAAVELTNSESAAILLLNEDSQTLYFATVTSHAEQLMTISVPIEKSIAGAAFTSGQPVIVSEVDKDPRYFSDAEQQTGLVARSLLALPLQYNEQRIGVLEVENKRDDNPFDQEDIELLTALAAQATVTIENARLTTNLEEIVQQRTLDLETAVIQLKQEISQRKQADQLLLEQQKKLIVMQERERFAQELHDGLGQIMGYINLQLQTAQDLLTQGHKNQLQTTLQKLSAITQDSHADIRASILGIRNQTEISQNFTDTLNTYLEEYQQLYDITVKTSYPKNLPPHPFAPIVEDQILRLIQEALTNIRKHAQVQEAQLLLLLNDEQAQIIIEDEGIGFDLSSQASSEHSDMHFGLTIMQQRSQEIGGELQIRTALGKGTKIIIQIPRWPESNIEALRSFRLMLVDDHPLFLEGLQDRLTTRGIPVIGIAHDGKEAQKLAFSLRPDLILMDIHMPLCDGIEATRQIKSAMPDVKIAMLTVSGDNESLYSALKYGADGYLLKEMSGDLFLEQLSALAKGEVVVAPEVAAKMLAEFVQLKEQAATIKPPPSRNLSLENTKLDLLTPRQQEILGLVAQGMTYKEVGAELHLTESAIKYHMGKILKQLHVKKRKEAVMFIRRKELTQR